MSGMDLHEHEDPTTAPEPVEQHSTFADRVLNSLRAHKAAVGASLAAAAGVAALVFATSSAAVATGLNVTDSSYPTGTTAIADVATDESYKLYPTGSIETSYNTTEFAGRLWADKTVYVPDDGQGNLGTTTTIALADETLDLDGDATSSRTTAGQFQVDKTESGIFETEISLLSSSLTTEKYEPVPLDIVLVLDTSTSMKEKSDAPVDTSGYNMVNHYLNEDEIKQSLKPDDTFSPYKYFSRNKNGLDDKKYFEGYVRVADENGPLEDSSGRKYRLAAFLKRDNVFYIVTDDPSLFKQPVELTVWFEAGEYIDRYATTSLPHTAQSSQWTTETFYYTGIWGVPKIPESTRIEDLRYAVNDFIDSIAANNNDLAAEGYGDEYMSRISLVKFASEYANNGETARYQIKTTNIGGSNTQIITPLTAYTTSDATSLETVHGYVDQLQANGSTYADYGLTLAEGVLKDKAYVNSSGDTPGARDDVKKVILFFTDGNPKHVRGESPRDFSGLYAQKTWEVAERIKQDEDVTIYSVAVLAGADASDTTTMNANIYLNGVSSNYPNATATGGVDNPSEGYVYDETTGEFTDIGPQNKDKYLVRGTNYGATSVNVKYYTPSEFSWTPTLGTPSNRIEDYVQTSDEAVIRGKEYYTRTGLGTDNNPYVFTKVPSPVTANIGSYYEKLNYYLVANGGSIADAFTKVLNQITSGGGDTSITTGRDGNTGVTITDYLGDYMEFKGVDGILYGTSASTTQFYAPGTQGAYHVQAQVQRDDRSATLSVYTMWCAVPSALLSPNAGEETTDLKNITIKVERSTNPQVGDTVTITVPPELIPSLRYIVQEQHQAATQDTPGGVTTFVRLEEADPLRIFYSVGPKATTLSNVISQLEDQALRDPNAYNESDKQTEAYRNFVGDAATDGHDNVYPLYNNAIKPKTTDNMSSEEIASLVEQANTMGTTKVTMAVADTNPFYFFAENEQLYEYYEDTEKYVPATSSNYAEGDTLYWIKTVWTVSGNSPATSTEKPIEWKGNTITDSDNNIVIPAGTAKIQTAEGKNDYTSGTFAKDDATHTRNLTGTATNYLTTIFNGADEDDAHQKIATFYLGNNGRLDIPVYGTLSVEKDFEADTGFDLPENATASFTLTLKGEGGSSLTGPYPALIRDSQGHPVDPSTHSPATAAESVRFTVRDGSTFTLRDGETLRVTGLPDGATYQVVEEGQPGYKATVTNNDRETIGRFDRGKDSSTAQATPAEGGSNG